MVYKKKELIVTNQNENHVPPNIKCIGIINIYSQIL